MTIEEAIAQLNPIHLKLPSEEYEMAARYMGMTALRKSIPVSPSRQYLGSKWHYICGSCGIDINTRHKYCHACGKKIKWEE